MAVAKIEAMSNRKLTVIIFLVILIQIIYLVVPTFFIPDSADSFVVHGKMCVENNYNDPTCMVDTWYLSFSNASNTSSISTRKLNGFGFPIPRLYYGKLTDYSKWRSKVMGFLTVSTTNQLSVTNDALPTFWNVNLLSSYTADDTTYWSLRDLSYLHTSFSESYSENSTFNAPKYSKNYWRNRILLEFEPGYYDNFFVAIVNEGMQPSEMTQLKMSLQMIVPNEQYLEFMVYMKLAFFAVALVVCIFYRVNVSKNFLTRDRAIHLLKGGLLILNLPLEFLTSLKITLWITKDVRTDIFYFILMVSWLIFVLDCSERQSRRAGFQPKRVKPTFTLVISFLVIGMMVLFHASENYQDIKYPFANLTAAESSKTIGLLALVSLISYIFIHTIYLTVKSAQGIAIALFNNMSNNVTGEYSYRHNRWPFLLISSTICMTLTIVDFISWELTRYQTKWMHEVILGYPMGMSIGIFAMWNIYTLMLVYLYAPKREESTVHAVTELVAPPSYDEYMRTANESPKDGQLTMQTKHGKENIYVM